MVAQRLPTPAAAAVPGPSQPSQPDVRPATTLPAVSVVAVVPVTLPAPSVPLPTAPARTLPPAESQRRAEPPPGIAASAPVTPGKTAGAPAKKRTEAKPPSTKTDKSAKTSKPKAKTDSAAQTKKPAADKPAQKKTKPRKTVRAALDSARAAQSTGQAAPPGVPAPAIPAATAAAPAAPSLPAAAPPTAPAILPDTGTVDMGVLPSGDIVLAPDRHSEVTVRVAPPDRESSAHPANWPLPAGGILPLDPGLDLDLDVPADTLTDSISTSEYQLFSYHPGAGECVDHRVVRQVAEETAVELNYRPPPPLPAPQQFVAPPPPPPTTAVPQYGMPQAQYLSPQVPSQGTYWPSGTWSGTSFQGYTTPQLWSPAPAQHTPSWQAGWQGWPYNTSTPTTTTATWSMAGTTTVSPASSYQTYGHPQSQLPPLNWGNIVTPPPPPPPPGPPAPAQVVSPAPAQVVSPAPQSTATHVPEGTTRVEVDIPLPTEPAPATPPRVKSPPPPHLSPASPGLLRAQERYRDNLRKEKSRAGRLSAASLSRRDQPSSGHPSSEEDGSCSDSGASDRHVSHLTTLPKRRRSPSSSDTSSRSRRRVHTSSRERREPRETRSSRRTRSPSPQPQSLEELLLAMENRLLGHIDSRLDLERGQEPTTTEAVEGSTTIPDPPPPSRPPRASSQASTQGEDELLRVELQTLLPNSSSEGTPVVVKQEPDSDLEILSSPPPSPPPRPSPVAQAAAGIDQAMCRLHVKQACQVLGKAPGTVTDSAQQSASASAMPSLRRFREHGMLPEPEIKIAWPHDESLDDTQALFTADLQRVNGPRPARDLFSIPPPPKTGDKFLPLPTRKIPRDQWYYMSQTAPKPSWGTKAPKESALLPGHPTPAHFILPASQYLAQETNLRYLSHHAAMSNNAALAVSEVLFHMYDQGLWPTEPIRMPGVEEPIRFEWFLSMAQLMGASSSQIAHNAVCAAMNLQLARRDVFLHSAGRATGVSQADRDRLRVAPMDSEDLFGSQAAHLADRRALFEQTRPQRNYSVATRVATTPGSTASPQQSTPPQSQSSTRRRSRSRRRRSSSASRQTPATSPNPQSFRSGSSRGRGSGGGGGSGQSSRGRGNNSRSSGSGGAGRGRSRSGQQ